MPEWKRLNVFRQISIKFLFFRLQRHTKQHTNLTIRNRLENGSVVTFNIVVSRATIWLMRTIRNSRAEGYRFRSSSGQIIFHFINRFIQSHQKHQLKTLKKSVYLSFCRLKKSQLIALFNCFNRPLKFLAITLSQIFKKNWIQNKTLSIIDVSSTSLMLYSW